MIFTIRGQISTDEALRYPEVAAFSDKMEELIAEILHCPVYCDVEMGVRPGTVRKIVAKAQLIGCWPCEIEWCFLIARQPDIPIGELAWIAEAIAVGLRDRAQVKSKRASHDTAGQHPLGERAEGGTPACPQGSGDAPGGLYEGALEAPELDPSA